MMDIEFEHKLLDQKYPAPDSRIDSMRWRVFLESVRAMLTMHVFAKHLEMINIELFEWLGGIMESSRMIAILSLGEPIREPLSGAELEIETIFAKCGEKPDNSQLLYVINGNKWHPDGFLFDMDDLISDTADSIISGNEELNEATYMCAKEIYTFLMDPC